VQAGGNLPEVHFPFHIGRWSLPPDIRGDEHSKAVVFTLILGGALEILHLSAFKKIFWCSMSLQRLFLNTTPSHSPESELWKPISTEHILLKKKGALNPCGLPGSHSPFLTWQKPGFVEESTFHHLSQEMNSDWPSNPDGPATLFSNWPWVSTQSLCLPIKCEEAYSEASGKDSLALKKEARKKPPCSSTGFYGVGT
jgi:hypothetical protein